METSEGWYDKSYQIVHIRYVQFMYTNKAVKKYKTNNFN